MAGEPFTVVSAAIRIELQSKSVRLSLLPFAVVAFTVLVEHDAHITVRLSILEVSKIHITFVVPLSAPKRLAVPP